MCAGEGAGVPRGGRGGERRQGGGRGAERRQSRRQGCREEAGVPRGGRGVHLLSHWASVFHAHEVQFPARRRLSGRPFREPGMRSGHSWEVEAAPAVRAEESKRKSCECKGLLGRMPLSPQRDSWNKGKTWNCSSLGSEEGPGPGRGGTPAAVSVAEGRGHARGWFCRSELQTG